MVYFFTKEIFLEDMFYFRKNFYGSGNKFNHMCIFVFLLLAFCPSTKGKLNNLPLVELGPSNVNKFNYCTVCSWNIVRNESLCLPIINSLKQENRTHIDQPTKVLSLQQNICLQEGGTCHILFKGMFCYQEDVGTSTLKLPVVLQNSYLKLLLVEFVEILADNHLEHSSTLQAFLSKLMVKIASAAGNEVQKPKTGLCSDIKTLVFWLILSSDKLIDYFIVPKVSNTMITEHNFKSRPRGIRKHIDRILYVFNLTDKMLGKCLTPVSKETMLQTKNIFLWVKMGKPSKFNNLSCILKKQNTFIRMSTKLQTKFAYNFRKIKVHFIYIKNLFMPSLKKNCLVKDLPIILLSITEKGGKEIKRLSFPIDLFFRYKFKAEKNSLTKGIIHSPSKPDYSLFDRDKLLSVHRLEPLHLPGTGALFFKFYNLSKNEFKVFLSENIPPSQNDVNLYGQKVTFKFPVYKVSLENQTNHSVNYLGLVSSRTKSGATIEYSFETRYVQCYSRFKTGWKSDGCRVGNETNETLIHCQCWHLSMFGGSAIIAPRQFNLKEDIKLISDVKDAPMTTIVVVSILLLYLISLVWTRHNDGKDRLQRFVIVQDDNFPGEEQPYLLTVFTGPWIGAGTDANIAIRLYGSKGMSRIHNLQNIAQRKLLKANCDDWFLIFTRKSIGDIERIHIFGDYSGQSPDWYCKKIIVYDLEGEKEFKFIIERWVSLAEEDDCVDFYCYPISAKKSIRRDRILIDNVVFGLWETHLLLSIFTRHPRSSITRSQRLSILVTILLVKLLTSVMFHELESSEYPQYSEVKRKLIIEMESTLLTSPFTFIVIFCFKKSRIITAPGNDVPMTLTSTQAVPLETGLEINQSQGAILKPSTPTKNNVLTMQKPTDINSKSLALEEEEEDDDDDDDEDDDDEDVDVDEEEVDEEEEDDSEFNDEDTEEEEEVEVVEEEEEPEEVDAGCWISCYKQIKALLFQVVTSKVIMPVKIAEEDEVSARVRKKWMYFAWLLCETAIFSSAFSIIVYSLKMQSESRKKWLMQGMTVYSLQNIFFMAPVKIFIFAAVLAVLYGQLHYIPSYECNTEAAMKKVLAGNKRFLSKLMLMRKNKWYKPLSSNHIKTIRIKQKNWRRWRIVINFFVLVLMYMVLFCNVLLTWDGPYIQFRHHLHSMFNPELNNHLITKYKYYEEYIRKIDIPGYSKRTWYNNMYAMNIDIWKQEMGFLSDYVTRLVGVPRFRQQRVKPDSCIVNPLMSDKVTVQCNAPLTWASIDKKDYAVSWTQPEKFTPDLNSPWVFSGQKNSPIIICSYDTAKCYLPGGYVMKLRYNESDSDLVLNDLFRTEWFDSLTRVVFLEMVIYNVNTNFICYIVPTLEKLATGHFFIHVQSVIFHPQSKDFVKTITFMIFFTSYYLFRIILLFNRCGLKYLISWTGLLDVFLNVLLYVTIICMCLYSNARTDYLHQWQLEEEKDLQITKDVFLFRDVLRYEISVLVIIIPMQVLHNFRFGKAFLIYFRVFYQCLKICLGLASIIVFYFAAFHLIIMINNANPVYCLFNRTYNSISYCSNLYSLSHKLGPLNLLFWFEFNFIAFVACVGVVYSYKSVKDRSRYSRDFNIVVFIFVKLRHTTKRIQRSLFKLKKKMTSFTRERLKAGADELFDSSESDDVFPENKTLAYTNQLGEDLKWKLDCVRDKLLDLKNSM